MCAWSAPNVFLKFEDFSILTKRIIDLTLDTEDVNQYKKTNAFLIWLDQNENDLEAKKEKMIKEKYKKE